MALAAGFASMPALAQVQGGTAIHGTISVQQQGSVQTVTTTNGAGTNHSAANWLSFNVPGGTTTHFAQPNAASTSINRVIGSDPSAIFGTLSSNGRLVLVNPNGITVGAGAVVDTAGFIASTVGMSELDAIAGRLRFDGAGAGPLRVDGHVLARQGDVVLIGSKVETGAQALIESPNGATILAAGQKVEVTGRGLEGIFFEVQAPTDQVVNLGTLRGDAVGVFAGTLKHSGLVQAQAVSTEGGKVVLRALDQAVVAGRIEARGANGAGGQVDVLGDKVGLVAGAVVDTSNTHGGGQIRVGGDYQGKNADVKNASVTYVDRDARLLANATENGDGGKVIVWADDTTRMFGRIEANGGADGGNGGFVETSGKRFLDIEGSQVQARAPKGENGTWLLDPSDIRIVAEVPVSSPAPVELSGGPDFTAAPDNSFSYLTVATLNAALNDNANVVVMTDGGTGSGAGDIVFTGGADLNIAVTGSSSTLELKAHNKIRFENGTTTRFQALGAPGSHLDVKMYSGAGVFTENGATVELSASDNANGVLATVMGGKTWENQGNLVLNLNAQLKLKDGAMAATFTNKPTGSVSGAMGPSGGVFDGAFANHGQVNLTQGRFQVDSLVVSGGSDFKFDGQRFSSGTTTVGAYYAHASSFDVRTTDGDIAIDGDIYVNGLARLRAEGGALGVAGGITAGSAQLHGANGVDFAYINTAGDSSRANGGVVVITSGGSVTGDWIDTTASTSLGSGSGGAVSITAAGNVEVYDIWARGGTAYSGVAGSGGNVSISAGGSVSASNISTYGGSGSGSGTAGGSGGSVSIQAGGGVTLFSTEGGGSISTSGGSADYAEGGTGGAGGNAGNVTIVAGGPVSMDGSIDAAGGSGGGGDLGGGSGGQGGNVSIQSTGPVVIQGSYYGAIDTSGGGGGWAGSAGNGGTGGHAGSVSISADGASSLGAAIYAEGGYGGSGGTGGLGGNGGAAGNVNLTLASGASMTMPGVHAAGGIGGDGDAGKGANGAGGTFTSTGGTIRVAASYDTPSTSASSGEDTTSMDIDANWINSSNVVLDPGAWVRVNGNLTNSGTLDLGSASLLSLGSYDDASDVFTPGGGMTLVNTSSGVLQGFGHVQGNVDNAGTIRPGGAGVIGRLTILGNLVQQATGRLEFDVAANSPYIPGQTYDQLRVQGNLALGGQVFVNAVPAVSPTAAPVITPPSPPPTPTPTYSLAAAIDETSTTSTTPTPTPIVQGSSEPTATYELIHADSVSGSAFSLISGPADTLALSRLRVGDSLQELPGVTASDLMAQIAKMLPGVSVATIQQVLVESFNNSISSDDKPEDEDGEGNSNRDDVVVTDNSCKPAS
jgi:filamentous hemagglutinin family protein